MVTRGLLVVFAIVLFFAGTAAAVATVLELSTLGVNHRAAIAIGVANGFTAWVIAFVCTVLASVHHRVAYLEEDVEDLTTADHVGILDA